MNYLKISDLRMKIFTMFRPGRKENRTKVKISEVGIRQLLLENPVFLKDIDNILQVTVYLHVRQQWKAYQIINICPDLDTEEDGKVSSLNFQLGEAERIDFEEVFSFMFSSNEKLAA